MNLDNKISLILQSDVSNKKIADYTGVDVATVSRLRNGHRIVDGLQFGTVKRLVKAVELIDSNPSLKDI